MIYAEYTKKAAEATIFQAPNGLWYLEPDWKVLLIENDLHYDQMDSFSDWADVEDVLKLEVEKRNTINNKQNAVMEWLYELLTSAVDTSVTDFQNDIVSDAMQYLQLKSQLEEGKEQ